MVFTGGNPLTYVGGVAPELDDWQIAMNGLLLGPNTSYMINAFDGFGSPEVRVTDMERSAEDGDWIGIDTYSSRTMTVTLTMKADTAAAAHALYNAFLVKWRVDRDLQYSELWWKLPGVDPRRIVGRPRRVQADTSRLLTGKITLIAEFYTPLAEIYGEDISFGFDSTALAAYRTYDPTVTYPRTYSRAVGAIVNPGSFEAYPILEVNGPDPVPRVYLGEVGGSDPAMIGFDSALASSADKLVIDMKLRTAYKNGVSVRAYLRDGSTWWTVPPGVSQLYYYGAGYVSVTYAASSIG